MPRGAHEQLEVGALALEEKVRVAAPDGLVAEVDGLTGRRYKATGGGMYEMHPRDARALLAEGGFRPTIGGPTIRGGYACPSCGFRAVVRLCSRCGERCETDVERRARLVELAASQNTPEVGLPPVGDAVQELVDLVRDAGSVVMEYEINSATGETHEIGPVRREAPIVVRPQDLAPAARAIVFGALQEQLTHVAPSPKALLFDLTVERA